MTRIIAAVVDEDAAMVAAHDPAGEHDLRHMDVGGVLDAAVSPGREQDGDGSTNCAGFAEVVQRYAEHVGVAVHGGAHPVEHAEPALGGPEGRRARGPILSEKALSAPRQSS